MKYNILGSSSKGNCLIIEDKIVIDMGVTYSKIKDYVDNFKIVLLTHSHNDHLKKTTIKRLAKERPTLKFVCSSFLAPILIAECFVSKKNIIILDTNKMYDLGMFKCKMYDLYHDVPNFAYFIEYKGYKLFYGTDTGRIDHISCPGCDYYFVEANYNEELMQKHIRECIDNNDENQLYYLQRTVKTHLSDVQMSDFIIKNMKENGKYCILHKSLYNYEE